MEIKKSKNAEIESRRGTWLLVGFVTVLAFMFVTFEWANKDKEIDTSMLVRGPIFELEMVPISMPEKPLPPPPATTVTPEVLVIVDNSSAASTEVNVGTETTHTGIVIPPPPVIETPAPVEDIIVVFAEVMPSFPGGAAALNAFLGKNTKYPTYCQENDIKGKVIVQFVVDKDGSITDPVVVRGVHPLLDKEALRVISAMPKWSPGMQQHKPVRVKYTVPVVFRLQ